MPNFRIRLAGSTLNTLKEMLSKAEHRGDLRTVKRINAILAVVEGYSYSVIASILNVCESFLMPSKYTLKTIPMPSDPTVKIKQIPGRLMAARTYSGTWSKKRYEENKAKLERDIERRKLRVVGEPIWARYNPPFMPWFLRRNEVLIPVERTSE